MAVSLKPRDRSDENAERPELGVVYVVTKEQPDLVFKVGDLILCCRMAGDGNNLRMLLLNLGTCRVYYDEEFRRLGCRKVGPHEVVEIRNESQVKL